MRHWRQLAVIAVLLELGLLGCEIGDARRVVEAAQHRPGYCLLVAGEAPETAAGDDADVAATGARIARRRLSLTRWWPLASVLRYLAKRSSPLQASSLAAAFSVISGSGTRASRHRDDRPVERVVRVSSSGDRQLLRNQDANLVAVGDDDAGAPEPARFAADQRRVDLRVIETHVEPAILVRARCSVRRPCGLIANRVWTMRATPTSALAPRAVFTLPAWPSLDPCGGLTVW